MGFAHVTILTQPPNIPTTQMSFSKSATKAMKSINMCDINAEFQLDFGNGILLRSGKYVPRNGETKPKKRVVFQEPLAEVVEFSEPIVKKSSRKVARKSASKALRKNIIVAAAPKKETSFGDIVVAVLIVNTIGTICLLAIVYATPHVQAMMPLIQPVINSGLQHAALHWDSAVVRWEAAMTNLKSEMRSIHVDVMEMLENNVEF